MVICFKCDVETKSELDRLLRSGTYKDYSDVIAAAVANYGILHDELHSSGSVVIGEDSAEASTERPPAMSRTRPAASVNEAAPSKPHLVPSLPAIFRREPVIATQRQNAFAQLPDDVFLPGQEVPLDRWPFGQFSKLLPAKASCRALANIEISGEKPLSLESIATRIAAEATGLADYLAMLDEHLQLQRDDALAVGFPATSDTVAKSRLRYANQFVGALSKTGVLSGLLVDLKLINLTSARMAKVGLTRVGWEFALIENPVLDAAAPNGQKFSNEERSFLVDHVSRSVPTEAFAYRTILRAILRGATTPDALDQALQAHIPEARKEKITAAFITTQRSGVISRMADLGLLSRAREGVRVSYVPTETGTAFANRSAAA
jgi:hypothetical protein